MCLVVYVASQKPLPLLAWQQDAPAFNVTELTEHEQPVQHLFSLRHVRQAGSHTGCGCGFNEGREYPELHDDDAAGRAEALESWGRLVSYICKHRVEQIYSCWSGDEGEPTQFERRVVPELLSAADFYFRERELLIIDFDAAAPAAELG